MKGNAQEAIINAATAMLTPYFPELSAASLVEALKHRDTAPQSGVLKKPMTRHQVAELLGVSLNSINRYIRQGRLRAYKISTRLVRIDPRSVEALMQPGYAVETA